MTWNGAGACVIFSQSRQVNFSRTVSITFHWRGCRLQRPGHVLAELAQALPPQHSQAVGGSITTRSRGRWSGKVLRSGRLRVNPATVVVLATAISAAISSSVALGLQFLECERQLVDQPRRAFRALPVDLALQLGDPQLLLGDQRHVFGRLGSRDRQFRGDFQSVRAGDHQRRLQGGDIVGKSVTSGVHDEVNHKFGDLWRP